MEFRLETYNAYLKLDFCNSIVDDTQIFTRGYLDTQ